MKNRSVEKLDGMTHAARPRFEDTHRQLTPAMSSLAVESTPSTICMAACSIPATLSISAQAMFSPIGARSRLAPLTGNLDQKAGGTFAVDVNMRNNTADRLNVSGTAVLRGKMVPDVLMLGRLHVFKSHRHGPLAGDSRERPLFVEQFRACGI
jgi:hypothetical protein